MNLYIDRAEITETLWDEIIYIADIHGIDLSHSTGCHLDISDIEPTGKNIMEIEFHGEEL